MRKAKLHSVNEQDFAGIIRQESDTSSKKVKGGEKKGKRNAPPGLESIMHPETLDSNVKNIEGYHSHNAGSSFSNMNESGKGPEVERKRSLLIAPGELIENHSKRSESSNRKYRAFKSFLK